MEIVDGLPFPDGSPGIATLFSFASLFSLSSSFLSLSFDSASVS